MSVFKILTSKYTGNIYPGRPEHRCEGNIRRNPKINI